MALKEMTLESFMKKGPVRCYGCNAKTAQKGVFQGLRRAFSKGGEVISDEMKTMLEKGVKTSVVTAQRAHSER